MAKNNSVRFIGNLTADPVLREFTTANGKSKVANYDIAVHTAGRTDFIRIASWGAQAENDVKYLKKGNMVMVDGDIQTGSYEKDGYKIPTFQVNAADVTYLLPANVNAKTDKKTTPQSNSDEEFT